MHYVWVCYDFKSLDVRAIGKNELSAGYKKMQKTPCMLAVKFMKFLCAHTFKYQLTFNLKKGKVFKKALT